MAQTRINIKKKGFYAPSKINYTKIMVTLLRQARGRPYEARDQFNRKTQHNNSQTVSKIASKFIGID